MSDHDAAPANPHCELCKHNHAFDLPADVLDAAHQGRLVVFAGAGISTESSKVMPYTFYDEIARDLGRDPEAITTSFPELMSQYCKQPNGRRKLLQRLKHRFDYIESFPWLLQGAVAFHEELSTIPHFEDIVTTNWDDYFERFCGATPFVSPQDFVFWNMPGRKVFKIHGSVNSYSSIIATNEDYEASHRQLTSGLIGSNLKMLLATKVVVFVGYSFRDHDFIRIYDFLKDEMKDMLPHAYAITISEDSANHFRSMGFTPIVTDGTFFFQVLKSHLVGRGNMVPDERFVEIGIEHACMRLEHALLHSKFRNVKNPELVYCASYQDGVMDAFGRISQCKMTGEYSCPGHLKQKIEKYIEIQAETRRKRIYLDVAYIEGYINGMLYLVMTDEARKHFPRYFLYGYKGEIRTFRQYQRACKKAQEYHRAAYRYAVKIASLLGEHSVGHHTPFLDLA